MLYDSKLSDFKRLDIDDRDLLAPFLLKAERQSCEFAFSNLFLWSGTYHPAWSFFNGHLYLLLQTEDILMFAPGGLNGPTPDELIRVSDHVAEAGFSGSFDHVDAAWLKKNGDEAQKFFRIEQMNDSFAEYIYSVDALVNLHGAKLAKKKNLIHQFLNDYPGAAHEPVTQDNLAECLQLEEDWFHAQEHPDAVEVAHEYQAIQKLGQYANRLPVEGVLLRVDGRPVAFTMFSPIGPDIWTEHFEKTHYEYKGASQYICHLCAKALQGRAKWLNREQDLGIPGLRQAKQSYAPETLLQNYRLVRR